MSERPLRIALVGAGSLLGKALNDELAASAFAAADIHLVDDEEAFGKLAATGDEVTFIQHLDADSFEGCDFTFFAGLPEITRKHWQQALKAGSRIVDLSGELEGSPGIPVRAPWIQENLTTADSAPASQLAEAPDLQTRAVVAAHPVAVLLAMLATRIQTVAPIREIWATLLQPASEFGHAALEELHQQTTNLLSFQPLPTEVFGGQTAFNLSVSFPAESRINLGHTGDIIRKHYAKIAAPLAASLALQMVQVPAFHGYALSIAVELTQGVRPEALARSLSGSHVHVVPHASQFPGTVQAVEEDDVQVLVQPVFREGQGQGADGETDRIWLWVVADNLKFAARNAIACALELNRLRPRGSVQ